MKQGFKRIVSMALIASMIATMAPSTAWAASVDNTDAAQVEAQTATDEEVVPAAESAAETEAVEVQTETEPAATEETEAQTETEETEIQTEAEETETPVYSIGDIKINFQGANAAVAEQMAKDVEIDESDPAIQSLRKALEEVEIVGGEAGTESNESNISTADLYEADEQETTQKLTKDQINTVIGMYQNYLNQWAANANVLGVQNPYFLNFNDDNKDGLGILGEMLALDGASVQDVRDGKYTYDELTGMIITFLYGDQLGINYYDDDVIQARKDALAAVDASGAQTKAQKLLVLNDWLAHENTFDMSYIMNSGKSDDEKPMVAEEPDPDRKKLEQKVNDDVVAAYEPQVRQNFHDNIFAQIEDNLRNQFYENAIQQAVYESTLKKIAADSNNPTDEEKQTAQDQAKAYVKENKDAIDKDPDAYVRANFTDEAADGMKNQADAFIKDAEEKGVEVDPENAPGVKMTVEELTQKQLESDDPALDLDEDGKNETSIKDAIPLYAQKAGAQFTPAIINYWEGNQFGVFGMGTSVCLGYSKAFSYLVQCLDKDIYLIDPDKTDAYDSKKTVTADDGSTSEVCDNWKTSEELYYTNGALDISKNYTVDLVKIHFRSDVTMYGEEQEGFGSDHYWNAVKLENDKWYYIDSCYTDVYTEVMSRDRVETDGDMNHGFFMFSQTSTESLYKGNYKSITSLYTSAATDQSYEDAWMSRAASNVYYKDGYAYYLYDSTGLFSRTSLSQNQKASEYKLVRHNLANDDLAKDNDGNVAGESDYETLINFTDKENDNDTFVSVLKDGKMEKSDLLTKLYAQFLDEQSAYPAIDLTAALADNGKLYFNVSNDIVSYDPADGSVAVVKEYNEVFAKRDKTKLFGGMAFSTTDKEDNVDFTVTNHPIAGLTIKDGKMIVSIATNFAFISGKSSVTDHTNYGYSFEETDYNSGYTNYKYYQQIMGNQTNDNDEFMWSANFVDTVDMDTLTGTSHNYEEVSVPAFCGRNAFTEERCTDCGLIKDGTRVEEEGTAHDHHFIKFHEVYYTKDSSDKWNEADNYVCPECGLGISEPVEPNEKYATEQLKKNYKKKKALWDEAQKNAAEGHAYTPTDAKWSDDDSTVTFQKLECTTCKAQINKRDCLLESDDTNKANREFIDKTLDEAVTVKAELVGHTGTCDQGVTSTYKATGKTNDGYRYTATDKKTSDAGQHQYTGTWTWTEKKDDAGNVTGYTATVADVKCSVCGDVAKENRIKVKVAKDTENSKAATCTEAGKDVYTATATVTDADGKEIGTLTADPKEVDLPALEHKYGEPVWSDWEEKDGSWTTTATFTCANDKTHVQKPEVKVAETSDKPTCEEDGVVTYTASTEFNGQTYTNPEKKTVPVKAQGHDYQPVVTKKATTVNDGTIAYTCSRCNKVEKTETISHPKTIALEATTYTYTGQEIKPAVTVTAADGTTIAADKNYTVSYPTAKNVGKYTVKVTFTGDYYEGSVEKTFEITKATVAMKYTNESVVVDYTAKGTVDNALVTEASADSIAYTSSNEKVARVAEDGTVSIIGYGTVTITAKVGGDANYNDASAQYTLKINPLATPELPTVSNGTNGVNISWPAVEGAEKYRVFRKTSSSGWDAVGVTADTSIVDKGAKSGAEYAYVVRCYNDYNVYTSNYDRNGVKFICLNAGKITSAENGNGQVTLKWNQVSGADGYYVYRKEYGGSYKQIAVVKGEKNVSYTDKDTALTSSTVYVYAVRPYCGDTMGAFTGRCNTYLSTGVITSLSHTGNAIAVKWDAIDGAEGYYVYRKEYGGTYKQIAKVEGHDTLTYSDPSSSFKSGTTYVYAIRGYNGGSRGWFAGKCVNYLASGNITSLYNANDGIVVKWNKVAGAKGYYVYRKEYGGSYSKIATIKNGSTVSYRDKKAQNGVTYVYAVRPYNGNDSGYFTGKVVCRLQTPTITDVVSIGQGQVGIAWKENLEADGYQLQLADTSKFAKNETQQENVSVANGNAVAIEGLQKGETFYFRVRSYKKVGNKTDFSAWSTKSVKVTQ